MARFEFKLPDIGEGIAEAEVVAWHVAPGDVVEEDQPLADMMTDKATVEMTAPVAGTVVEIAGAVGDQLAIGSVLVVFDVADATEPTVQLATEWAAGVATPDSVPQVPPRNGEGDHAQHGGGGSPLSESAGESPLHPSPAASGSPPRSGEERVQASPAVRARAKDLGVDLAQVQPARDGRVRHADLDAYLNYNRAQGFAAPAAKRADEQVRVIGLRRRIAENMAASKRAIPHFTYVEELDVTALEAMRESLNAARGQRPKLTLLPFLIVALCRALPDFPMLNARHDDEAGVVTRSGAVHLGLATQTDAGLTVPVIRDAQDRNVWQLATEIRRLADAARSGRATSAELTGGTITLTSLGPLGGIATTPVINRPEVAIVGPNKVVERPVIRDGEIAVAKLMNLSISCDHRVVDGWDAASFVQAVKRLVETPALLFVD